MASGPLLSAHVLIQWPAAKYIGVFPVQSVRSPVMLGKIPVELSGATHV